MSDVFREVNEDLRREQLNRLWKRYGKFLIGLAILIVVAVAAYQIMQSIQNGKEAESGDRYQAAVDLYRDGSLDEAATAFQALIGDGYGTYPTLALMAIAGIRAEQGDARGAVEAFDEVAADDSVDPELRDTARIRAAYLLVDSAPLADIQQRLSQFNVNGNPYRVLALEVMAVSAIAAGEYDQAGQWVIQMVQDPFANQTTNARATVLFAYINAHMANQTAQTGTSGAATEAPPTGFAAGTAGAAATTPAETGVNPFAAPAATTPAEPAPAATAPGVDTLMPLLPGLNPAAIINPLAAPAGN